MNSTSWRPSAKQQTTMGYGAGNTIRAGGAHLHAGDGDTHPDRDPKPWVGALLGRGGRRWRAAQDLARLLVVVVNRLLHGHALLHRGVPLYGVVAAKLLRWRRHRRIRAWDGRLRGGLCCWPLFGALAGVYQKGHAATRRGAAADGEAQLRSAGRAEARDGGGRRLRRAHRTTRVHTHHAGGCEHRGSAAGTRTREAQPICECGALPRGGRARLASTCGPRCHSLRTPPFARLTANAAQPGVTGAWLRRRLLCALPLAPSPRAAFRRRPRRSSSLIPVVACARDACSRGDKLRGAALRCAARRPKAPAARTPPNGPQKCPKEPPRGPKRASQGPRRPATAPPVTQPHGRSPSFARILIRALQKACLTHTARFFHLYEDSRLLSPLCGPARRRCWNVRFYLLLEASRQEHQWKR
eukprot:scaffold1299_cov331-Prasinococcus_capsulatus_cf.AAC.1